MIIIRCKHGKKQKVLGYIDGVICEPKISEYESIFKVELPMGKHKIRLEQMSTFNTWYWWITLIPFYWLIKGGLLLNYFLGYDAEFAQTEIDFCVDNQDRDLVFDVSLSEQIYKKSFESTTDRAYYEFEVTKSKDKGAIYSPDLYNLKRFRVKWISSQLVIPMFLLVGIIYIIIENGIPWDFGLILSLIGFSALIAERITRVLLTKSKEEELQKLKAKKDKINGRTLKQRKGSTTARKRK